MENNKHILERAIQKAIDGGWQPYELSTGSITDKIRYTLKFTKPSQIRGLIFDQEFAKALWGEKEIRIIIGAEYSDEEEWGVPWNIEDITPKWKYKLSQMVISPDFIKYLEDNI